ncbi:VOC family protein [Janibacter sp. UYMM211]|uniref:VOC family protein n=1 Tax=Janibacter sp. UYMM211 TaxID=3156342 RepID=UPI003399C994
MTLAWYTLVVDATDIAALSRWWAQTLDWHVVYEDEHEVAIAADPEEEEHPVEDLDAWLAQRPSLVFVPVPEAKTVKNRLHIDLAPHLSQDRDAEIAALVERGATQVDVGQSGDVTWTVLADPEGNEFCVLSRRDR